MTGLRVPACAAALLLASAAERAPAYAIFKGYIELLLTIQRETLQDVGFWAAVEAGAQASGTPRYRLSLAPDVDLQADGTLAGAGPHYPRGRAIAIGLPPGIR